ncbi:histone-lysine N-methyltransferase SETMAR [Trichonephila clavipes]|nr:histone-lysine N-methyltransferase SETMAR [Trichonephila clavipes]
MSHAQKTTTEDNVTKIHDLVLADRQLKVREIAEIVGISEDRVAHTLHEIWEIKEQSKQWILPGEPAPKKAKTFPSAGKVMTTVFWDSHSVIYIDYLEKGKTVTGQYYVEFLGRFDPNFKTNGHIWRRIKGSSTTTVHGLTPPHSPWLN